MGIIHLLGLALLLLSAQAQPHHQGSISKRCVNSAEDRSCWGDYDLDTNWYDEVPETGVTREYWFDIVNTTAAPDGVDRIVLSVVCTKISCAACEIQSSQKYLLPSKANDFYSR